MGAVSVEVLQRHQNGGLHAAAYQWGPPCEHGTCLCAASSQVSAPPGVSCVTMCCARGSPAACCDHTWRCMCWRDSMGETLCCGTPKLGPDCAALQHSGSCGPVAQACSVGGVVLHRCGGADGKQVLRRGSWWEVPQQPCRHLCASWVLCPQLYRKGDERMHVYWCCVHGASALTMPYWAVSVLCCKNFPLRSQWGTIHTDRRQGQWLQALPVMLSALYVGWLLLCWPCTVHCDSWAGLGRW